MSFHGLPFVTRGSALRALAGASAMSCRSSEARSGRQDQEVYGLGGLLGHVGGSESPGPYYRHKKLRFL